MRTDRTVPDNKQDITMRDKEQGTCMLTDDAISGDRQRKKLPKYKYCTYLTARVECKSKSDTSNNRDNWNQLNQSDST